jgi:group I intron endonuclease
MIHYIYILQNKINLKIYVGKTYDPESRFMAHLYAASGNTLPNKYLIHRAIAKYGQDNFIFQTIDEFDNEKECLEAEKFWIEFFRSDVNRFGSECGYNLTAGGEGISGFKHSQEAKNKVSIANTGRVFSNDTRNRMSAAHTGKPSPMLGHIQTAFQKEAQSNMVSGSKNYFYGKSFSGELNAFSVLTEKQVIEIINFLKNKTYKQNAIAKMYGVTPATINKIKTKRSWTHLER